MSMGSLVPEQARRRLVSFFVSSSLDNCQARIVSIWTIIMGICKVQVKGFRFFFPRPAEIWEILAFKLSKAMSLGCSRFSKTTSYSDVHWDYRMWWFQGLKV